MSSVERIKQFKKRFYDQALRVEKIITNGKKRSVDRRSLTFYELKIGELQNGWAEFKTAESNLKEQLSSDIDTETFDSRYDEVLEKYSEYIIDLREGFEAKKKEDPSKSLSDSRTEVLSHHLPTISLPKFSGDYAEWRSFRDLYISIVHENNELSAVQKLHYLKGCLTGEADRLLKNVPVTNESYLPAWEKLTARFENKRILINAQFHSLFNQAKISNETSKTLRLLVETSEEALQQLKILGLNTISWDPLLIYMMIQKLLSQTIKLWEESLGSKNDLPKLAEFLHFITNRAVVLESVANTIQNVSQGPSTVRSHFTKPASLNKCVLCPDTHNLYKCPKFIEMTIAERKTLIFQQKRCFNCLAINHSAPQCLSTSSCRICQKKHHTLLHQQQSLNQSTLPSSSVSSNEVPGNHEHESLQVEQTRAFFNARVKNAILSTARVIIKNKKGQPQEFRCLIDLGSEADFITKDAPRQLGIEEVPTNTKISGLNQNSMAIISTKAQINIESRTNHKFLYTTEMYVINTITDSIPSARLCNRWLHTSNLQLSDPEYWKPGPVDILLGVETYAYILEDKITKGLPGNPIAIKTSLGWILLGSDGKKNTRKSIQKVYLTSLNENTADLNSALLKFWEIEEVQTASKHTKEEEECEQHYQVHTTRLPSGQYQVKLPFKEKVQFGETRNQTYKMYNCLQRKLQRNPKLKEDYYKCLNEYISLNHMSKISTNTEGYYIPHHAVIKESSTTTKTRVVFNASHVDSNGMSLNSTLHTGPVIQPKLSSTLLKWRKYNIVLTADIEKMYRAILIHPNHRQFQKIVWEDPGAKTLQDFELNTVTFGTTPAPFLAIRTLQQLAKDEEKNFLLASSSTKHDFYVDLLTGADNLEEAFMIRNQYSQMLQSAGFKLRKWASNKLELLDDLPTEDVELNNTKIFQEDESIKALGIVWIPKYDVFVFKAKVVEHEKVATKEQVLSEIASLYDPLGWLSPILIIPKILMQDIWISGCSWDEILPRQLEKRWLKFKEQLTEISRIRIPRWIGYTQDTSNCLQLHGFADASTRAYGAVLYLRIEHSSSKTSVRMLTSKTKVVPIKPITIPRLELNAALLLSKLIKNTIEDLKIPDIKIFAWTDSVAEVFARTPHFTQYARTPMRTVCILNFQCSIC